MAAGGHFIRPRFFVLTPLYSNPALSENPFCGNCGCKIEEHSNFTARSVSNTSIDLPSPLSKGMRRLQGSSPLLPLPLEQHRSLDRDIAATRSSSVFSLLQVSTTGSIVLEGRHQKIDADCFNFFTTHDGQADICADTVR